jgi:hypothetical protein
VVSLHILQPTKTLYFATLADDGYGMSVSSCKPDSDVLTSPVSSQRPAKLSVRRSVYLSRRFARTVLNIPVPRVLAWSTNEQNPVQAEYIFMEEARGSQLHEFWDELPLRKKVDVIREIVDIERKLLSVSFDM